MKFSRTIKASLAVAALGTATAANAGKALETAHVADELIVGFKPGFHMASKMGTLGKLNAKVQHTFRSNGAMLLSVPTRGDSKSLAAAADWLRKQPGVAYVEPNTILRAYDIFPNDPRFGELYGLHNTGTAGTADADVDAPEAWSVTTGSRNVVVAIIDTGMDRNHPDLAANAWTNPGESGTDDQGRDKRSNGLDDDGNGYVDDWRGWDFANNDNDPMDDNKHGTHCAGTIGAVGDNGIGVAGVSWNVSLVGLKFLTGAGSGSLANAVKAIEYATMMGFDLTSNSWGGGGYSETMAAAIRQAADRGVLFVAAAGNESNNNDASPSYPATYAIENVISVAATDSRDAIASFSNRGERTVHLGAPGVDILSTIPNGGYAKLSGTSMATPHVSGAAALLKAAFPHLDARGLKTRLLASADPVRGLQGRTITGARLNVANALDDDATPPSAPADLVLGDSTLDGFDLAWNPSGDDGSEGRASRYEARIAALPITNEEEWRHAKVVPLAQQSGGDGLRGRVNGIPFNSRGFVALRAFDNVGNASEISESAAYSVKPIAVLWETDAESLDGATPTGSWGLEAVAGRGFVFSDSPSTLYGENVDSTLTLPEISIPGNDLLLSFSHKLDLEKNYDTAAIEVSSDGGQSWREVAEFTDKAGWKEHTIPLRDHLPASARSLTLRFRIRTDRSINYDGWLIDSVKVLAPRQ